MNPGFYEFLDRHNRYTQDNPFDRAVEAAWPATLALVLGEKETKWKGEGKRRGSARVPFGGVLGRLAAALAYV